MNNVYRLIWSDIQNAWIAVSEITTTRGKRNSGRASSPCRNPGSPSARFLLNTLAASLLLTRIAHAAPAGNELPAGGQVSAGQASISQSGNVMNINQGSERAAINWQSFNVGNDASVNFQQPDSNSVTLNRVEGGSPSQIYGQINANGKVFLTNSSGVYFAPGASVNVGGLVATTHSISDEDFMAGRDHFERNGATGSVVNEGSLSANELNGYIALLAPEVRNHGVIIARMGTVALAAGEAFELQFDGSHSLANIRVEPSAIKALVENHHAVQAPGGQIILSAKAANDLQGGVINNSGSLEASSLTQKGGRIILEGDDITLAAGSDIEATGATAGGEVLAGGDWQGSGTLHQATNVTLEQGARINVSATQNGDGGKAVLWSNVNNAESMTRVHGEILAHGGAESGDGGRIETSGHRLDVQDVRADASAGNGKAGDWLLDPYNVTIAGGGASGTGYASTYTPATDSTILAADVAASLESGTNVTITTGTRGGSVGDITVSGAIAKTSGNTDVTLTLQAANTIVVDQAISNTGGSGKLHVALDADNNNGSRDGNGIIALNNNISTGGGNISFGTGATATINGVSTKVGGDVYVAGSAARSLTTAGGNVTVNGEMLIANTSGLNISTGNGNVTFGGILNSGNHYSFNSTPVQWNTALTSAKSGSGSDVGATYLATITSRLENAMVSRTANYGSSWLGGHRGTINGSTATYDANWRWVSGPEGLANAGSGTVFYTQTNAGTGSTSGYSNWNAGEPNNCSTSSCSNQTNFSVGTGEPALQFTGNSGVWNDEPDGIGRSRSGGLGYNIETNLAASPLTVNAGTGTVTFSGAVGQLKSLSSLNVSAGTVAINGGTVTTEGTQTYSGNVTLGAASTTLKQTAANTNFTVPSGKSISNASGSDATLAIKTTGGIVLSADSTISSATGKLNTVLWSDTDNTDGGYVQLAGTGSTSTTVITTNGGGLWIGGSGASGTANWTPYSGASSIQVGDGFAKGTSSYGTGVFLGSGTINTGGGNIAIYGQTAVSASSSTQPGGTDTAHSGIYSIYTDGAAKVASLNAGSGTINLYGRNVATGGGFSAFEGLYLNGATMTSAAPSGNAITLIGDATDADTGAGTRGAGVTLAGRANQPINISATGGGNIVIDGTSTASTSANTGLNYGVRIAGTGATGTTSISTANGGYIAISGTVKNPNVTYAVASESSAWDSISSSGHLTIAGATPNGNNKPISIAGALAVAGTTTLTASGQNITANNALNDFAGAVTVAGNNVSLRDSNALVLGASSISGNMTLQSGGTLAQSGDLVVAGATSINAGTGNNITLDRAGNDFIGAVAVLSGNNVSLRDGNAFDLGVSTIGGTLTLQSGGALTQSGDLAVTGLARIAAGNDITLTRGGNDFTDTVAISGNNVSLRDNNALDLAGSIRGALTLQTGGALTQQRGGLRVGGATSISAGAGNNITLNRSDNEFGALSVLSGNNVSLRDGNTLDLGASIISGNLTLRTDGALTQSGDFAVTGATSITAGSGNNITLNRGGNDFIGAVAVVSGNNVSLRDGNALDLGASTINGTLTLQSGEALTQSGGLAVSGAISISAGPDNDITLNRSDNLFFGTVSVQRAGAVNIKSRHVLRLGNISASGDMTAEVLGGDLTLTGNISKSSGSDATLTARAAGAVIQNANTSVSSSSNKLNVVYWADADGSGAGSIFLKDSASIATNGGHLWMGGGNGSTIWNGLTVGNDYAQADSIHAMSIYNTNANYKNGISLYKASVNTGGGNVRLHGKSANQSGAESGYMGVLLGQSMIDSGDGNIDLFAVSTGSSNDFSTHIASHFGLLMGTFVDNTTAAILSGDGAITINGETSFSANDHGAGVGLVSFGNAGSTVKIQSVNGDINVTGRLNSTGFNGQYGGIHFLGSGQEMIVSQTGNIALEGSSANPEVGSISVTAGNTSSRLGYDGSNPFSGNITLKGNTFVHYEGPITAEKLNLLGRGATYTLANADNNVASLVANTGNVSYVDSDALTLGAITLSGKLNVATTTGNLTLRNRLQAGSSASDAVVLNAGANAAAGTATGGDILYPAGVLDFSTDNISVGSGGRVTLYSGGVASSNGLTSLVGSGSGHFRYNSDETTDNFASPLGGGFYAIYREQPTVTVTAISDTKTYDGSAYRGGNGFTASGFVNGDTDSVLTGPIVYGGTSQDAIDAGHYSIIPSGLASGLGYGFSYAHGTLTINKQAPRITSELYSQSGNVQLVGQSEASQVSEPPNLIQFPDDSHDVVSSNISVVSGSRLEAVDSYLGTQQWNRIMDLLRNLMKSAGS